MTRSICAAAAAIFLLLCTSQSEARRHITDLPAFDRHNPNQSPTASDWRPKRTASHRKATRHASKPLKRTKVAHRHGKRAHGHGRASASLDHVVAPLAAKARELIAACGARVISGYRPGARVRGYGTPSLHSRYPSQAIDMTGNTACIYPRMKGWKGGYSIDYAAVRHIHISLASDRRERGARFAHYGTRRYASRHR